MQRDTQFDPIAAGLLLGIANALVIAIGLSIAVPERGVGPAVFMVGFIPAIIIGALEGCLAHHSSRAPAWGRLLVLSPVPLGFVLVMGHALFDARAYGAAIPTLVAILILERSSRVKPLVPEARVS